MGDAESTSKTSLLLPVERVENVTWRDLRDGLFTAELKRLICFAAPMAAVVIAQFMLQIISMVMVGHLGNLSLASASLASSFCNVTGFSFIVGLSCALDTLSGQAYGAKLYRKVGVQTYTAMFCLALPLTRYFQNQSMITPLLITSCFVFCLHVPLCWLLVYKSGLGNLGGALALSFSNCLYTIILGSLMCFSSACSETRAPLSMEIFDGIGEFFRYALPSAAMICLEWWSYELIILLSGLLPNPQLETSVLSVCLQTTATVYSIHLAIAAAASTRISNELVGRNVFGHVFSSDKETIDYVAKMAPLVSISLILDGLQGVLSGIARGCGWQHIGAYINLGAFYLWGIPIAASLAFWIHLKGVGLWIGIQAGAVLQTLLLTLVTGCTNWESQADKARNRMALAYGT